MKILISFSYSGTNFCGLAKQPNKRTIQGELEKILSTFFGEKVDVFASGRTDAGVHAINQKAHFEISKMPKMKVSDLPSALNYLLPSDLKIISAKRVSENFHARFDVKKKTYVYMCYLSSQDLPLFENRALRLKKPVDLSLMREGAEHFVGTHNFTAFKSANSSVKDDVRTIFSVKVKKQKEMITFEFCGNGFLYNMVRIMVGTLLAVGEKTFAPNEIDAIVESEDRQRAGKTAPAYGLYLKDVKY